MKTSNYWNYRGKNAVSIAAYAPNWYGGREYKKLAPKYELLKKYKEDGDKKHYTEKYLKEVLDALDPTEIYEELGEDAVLLCWEKPGEFCHRRIIAAWFKMKLGIEVEEI